jgi:HD-GYP domain-containing protein (c-di-GMP phosphodiesterase class II)
MLGPVRLAELLIGLSSVADIGMGQPIGSALRTCRVALTLADLCDCDGPTSAAVFSAALLQHIGCTAYSHEASLLFANEIAIKQYSAETDFGKPREVVTGYLPRIVRAAPPGARWQTAANAVLRSGGLVRGYSRANCEVASGVARRLELPSLTQQGLLHIYETWDGAGQPSGRAGADISVVARIVNVAGCIALFDRLGGPDAAVGSVAQRAGRLLDPYVAARFLARPERVLAELADCDSETLLALDPQPAQVDPAAVLRVFADAVDLKSPVFHGHSGEVAGRAAGAAASLGLAAAEVRDVELAGLCADLGRAAVPTAIWENPAPLRREAWSQIHLHPYYSEQILARCESLSTVAALAGAHHERLDGSGYHRGTRSAQLAVGARVVAAADTFTALLHDRPHRPALNPARAAETMRDLGRQRKLDADAVGAVLDAEVLPSRRAARRSSLTDRQVEVLRLVADGLSNRQIAARLVISPRTAEHHVQDVYARIGVSSRAAAALYAMEHGLL